MLKNLDGKLLAKVNKQTNSDEGKECSILILNILRKY